MVYNRDGRDECEFVRRYPPMMIEELGPGVANVWNHLRPATRNLLEKAWLSAAAGNTQQVHRPTQYDPRADQELEQLLAALDELPQRVIVLRLIRLILVLVRVLVRLQGGDDPDRPLELRDEEAQQAERVAIR